MKKIQTRNLGSNQKFNNPIDLIDFYESLLNEKSISEANMLNTINQNFRDIEALQNETKLIRDQLKKGAKNLAEAQKENNNLIRKIAETTKPFEDLNEANLGLEKENTALKSGKYSI